MRTARNHLRWFLRAVRLSRGRFAPMRFRWLMVGRSVGRLIGLIGVIGKFARIDKSCFVFLLFLLFGNFNRFLSVVIGVYRYFYIFLSKIYNCLFICFPFVFYTLARPWKTQACIRLGRTQRLQKFSFERSKERREAATSGPLCAPLATIFDGFCEQSVSRAAGSRQ